MLVKKKTNIELLKACGFCLVGVAHAKTEPVHIGMLVDCMRKIVCDWQQLHKMCTAENNPIVSIFLHERPGKAKKFWICDGFFIEGNQENEVLDHCHYSGEVLRYAHNEWISRKERSTSFRH